MKQFYPFRKGLLFIVALCSSFTVLNSQDLPGTVTELENAPIGSIIIPMDNNYQVNSSGFFNLKSYGFIVRALNNSHRIKWVIRAGKAKDGIDLTVQVAQVLPTAGAAAMRDFRSGPMVILPTDTLGIVALLQSYNAALPVGQRVSMYRLTQAATIEVRYTLDRTPKVAILNDGGNQAIHLGYMTAAGIPSVNYSVTNGTNLISDCFTIATEPHVDGAGPYVDSVKLFVMRGGNFLAQCHAILSYENHTGGRYHTTNGVVTNNVNAAATTTYPNADMSFAQFHGAYTGNSGGSVRLWERPIGSNPANNFYSVVSNTLYPLLTGGAVSKLAPSSGGLVFYLGNHDFNDVNNAMQVNGLRMYMNAVLTPSLNFCNWSVWAILPVTIHSFSASKSGTSSADLRWTTGSEEPGIVYQVEKSTDGSNFHPIGSVNGRNMGTFNSYSYTDGQIVQSANFYRLKIISGSGAVKYSSTKMIDASINTDQIISLFPNPANTHVTLKINSVSNHKLQITITDINGRSLKRFEAAPNSGSLELPVHDLVNGSYSVIVRGANGELYQRKLVVLH